MNSEAAETCLILIAIVAVICGIAFGIGSAIKADSRLDAIEARLDAE